MEIGDLGTPLRSIQHVGPVGEAVKRLIILTRRVFDRVLGELSWMIARGIARDITNEIAISRLLVLAPHPDDETLACGASIQCAIHGGGEASVVAVSDGRHSNGDIEPETMMTTRRLEFSRATEELGLTPSHVEWWGYEDTGLVDLHDELVERICELIQRRQPTIVMAPWAYDIHPDHAALGRAARIAVMATEILSLEYVVWAWTRPSHLLSVRSWTPKQKSDRVTTTSRRSSFRPVAAESHAYLLKKSRALAHYRSQLASSAVEVDLPSGDGALDARFLKHFLYRRELFFPSNASES